METPNDRGAIDAEPEAALPDVRGELNRALEAFPGSIDFRITRARES